MLRHRYLAFGLCISCEPIRGPSRSLCTTLESLYTAAAAPLGFGFCLDYSVKNSFAVFRFVRPQLVRLIIHLQFWLLSSLFLLVFFDSQAGISLLGKVDRATPVDNQRRRGAAIAGFRTCCSEAGSICVTPPPNRELPEPFGRSGNPSSH